MTSGSNGNSPLNSGHRDMLIEAQRRLADVLPEIDKAEACGIDCGEFRQGHQYLADRVGRFLNTYFPGTNASGGSTGIPTSG